LDNPEPHDPSSTFSYPIFGKIHFNINFPSVSRSLEWCYPFRLTKTLQHFLFLPCIWSALPNHSNNIFYKVQITKLNIMLFLMPSSLVLAGTALSTSDSTNNRYYIPPSCSMTCLTFVSVTLQCIFSNHIKRHNIRCLYTFLHRIYDGGGSLYWMLASILQISTILNLRVTVTYDFNQHSDEIQTYQGKRKLGWHHL